MINTIGLLVLIYIAMYMFVKWGVDIVEQQSMPQYPQWKYERVLIPLLWPLVPLYTWYIEWQARREERKWQKLKDTIDNIFKKYR